MSFSSNLESKETMVADQGLAAQEPLESKETMVPEQGLAAGPTINKEVGINPVKASDGAETSLVVVTESDATTENAVLKMLIRAPRYFDGYGENDDEGEKDEPKRRRKRCYLCGNKKHEGKRCRKVTACLICSQKGHLVIDCPNKNVEEDCASILCLKCGNTGHDMFSCTNEYDSEDLKVIECYVCRQVGHLCCVDGIAEGPREASCYKCGQSGHFGSDCTKEVYEVGYNLEVKCRKCKQWGHSKRLCPKTKAEKAAKKKGAATKAENKKARNAQRRNNTIPTPTGNALQPRPPAVGSYYARPPQPNVVWLPPVVGPYYGRPGSNVWLSPQAAAARPNQGGASPLQHVVDCNQVAVHNFGHLTGFPYQYRRPQITQLPYQGVLPQAAYVPDWHYEKRTSLFQPNVNQQTGIQTPRSESGAAQNSLGFVNPTSLSNLRQSSTSGSS